MNGNLVYRERDVNVEGYGIDLEVERYDNSQLPTDQNTEWGDGWTLMQAPDLNPKVPGKEGHRPGRAWCTPAGSMTDSTCPP